MEEKESEKWLEYAFPVEVEDKEGDSKEVYVVALSNIDKIVAEAERLGESKAWNEIHDHIASQYTFIERHLGLTRDRDLVKGFLVETRKLCLDHLMQKLTSLKTP